MEVKSYENFVLQAEIKRGIANVILCVCEHIALVKTLRTPVQLTYRVFMQLVYTLIKT